MKMLNLGCGSRYHPDWVNVDLVSSSRHVLKHNLLEGIPFPAAEFDAVYHSHLLEHLTGTQGEALMSECFRVLKNGGVIRVVVPDLEAIVRCYLEQLGKALEGDELAGHNYDWIMLEMYDQAVRETSGGGMTEYLRRDYVPNEAFIIGRSSELIKGIRASYLRDRQLVPSARSGLFWSLAKARDVASAPKICGELIRRLVLRREFAKLEIGRFRASGEIHLWMYDRYSLNRLLSRCGFERIQVRKASDSAIPEWEQYELDTRNGIAHKPNSIFMEGFKPSSIEQGRGQALP